LYFLDVSETKRIVSDGGFSFDNLVSHISSDSDNSAADSRSADQYANSYLAAKDVLTHIGTFSNCLLYIHSMGNRTSMENSHLIHRIRLSYEETRPNFLVPGHLFERHDEYDLLTFCDMMINYRLEGVLVQHIARPWVVFGEDDLIHFFQGEVLS